MPIYRTTPFKNNSTTTSPGTGDDVGDGYEVGSIWTNTTTSQTFKCRDNTLGAARWSLDADAMSELQAIYAAAADRVTNTAADTAFANTQSIPASSLQAGDVVHVRAKVFVVGINGTNTHKFTLRLGTVAAGLSIADTGVLSFVANDYAIVEGTITIAANGAGGAVHKDVLWKVQVNGVPSETRTVSFDTAMDTTIARNVTVSALASAANVANQVDLRELEAWVERAGTVA